MAQFDDEAGGPAGIDYDQPQLRSGGRQQPGQPMGMDRDLAAVVTAEKTS
jgi:hypothetical protein